MEKDYKAHLAFPYHKMFENESETLSNVPSNTIPTSSLRLLCFMPEFWKQHEAHWHQEHRAVTIPQAHQIAHDKNVIDTLVPHFNFSRHTHN